MSRSTCRRVAFAAALVLISVAPLAAQNPNCGVDQGSQTTPLPNFSGTLPGSPEISTGGGSSHLFMVTQWGFARAPLTPPSDPAPYDLFNVGLQMSNGGIISIQCDCYQGATSLGVAMGPNGDARLISDWWPYDQGGPPGSTFYSGLPGQVAKMTAGGTLDYGQQVDLPGMSYGKVTAIYTGGKYFGYFPVSQSGVYVADITNPTGSSNPDNAIQPNLAIGWISGASQTTGFRLTSGHVSITNYDRYLLVGASIVDDKIRVAEINTTTGNATEVASVTADGNPAAIEIAEVNDRIFILAAEGANGLHIYEYDPLPTPTLVHVAEFAGDIKHVQVRGLQPYPALFLYRASGQNSFVDIYNTNWLVQGGNPLLVKSLTHYGTGGVTFNGYGFEAAVSPSGTTAYIYRKLTAQFPNPGQIRTDQIDISCIGADPTAPPNAVASMTNLSAQARSAPENTKNYFGDKWELIDSSTSFQPITNVQWDIHTGAAGPFVADTAWSGNPAQNPELEDINPAYWPCDPGNGGNLSLGTACWASLGSPAGGTFYLGLKTTNVNGASAPDFSSGVAVLAPTVSIVGYTGTVLQVLAGNPNNGDASASKGNTAEANFSWTFTPSGSATGTVVTIPTSATAFNLLATYKDGFSVTKSGPVQQVDLVPNFSLTPNPILKSAPLTLRNLMQKAAAATLNTVTYSIAPSGGNGTLANSFLPANGTATVTVPATVGNYTITLSYNYTDHNGNPQTAPVSLPFSVTDFTPVPSLGIYKGAGRTQPVGVSPGNPPSFGLTTGTLYYLWDDQCASTGDVCAGSPHPGAQFFKSSDANQSIGGSDTSIGTTTGAGPQNFTPTDCSTSCYVKVQVQGVVRAFKYTSAPGGGPGGGDNPSVTIVGPPTGAPGVAVTFTAQPANFSGTPSYEWDFGDGGGGTPPPPPPPPPPGGCPPVRPCVQAPILKAGEAYEPGSQTQSHVFAAAGPYTVRVRVTSGSQVATSQKAISIGTGGPPAPSNVFDVPGATFNGFANRWEVSAGLPLTFTAAEPDPAATFAWAFGDGDTAAGRTVTHAFRSAGVLDVVMTATGGGTQTSGTSVGSARFLVAPPSFQALMIPGAGSICTLDPETHQCQPDGAWATDVTITNPGSLTTTVTLAFAPFCAAGDPNCTQIPTDLSTLPFDSVASVPLGRGESWSAEDIVGATLGRAGAGKGILLVRFEGGNQVPIVTARVYFTAQGASFGTALPSILVGPYGPIGSQAAEVATGQYLIGLREDDLYRFNVSLFNASGEGGSFHVDAFNEDGVAVGSKDFGVPPYSQAGVNPSDVLTTIDPSKRYVLKVSNTSGALKAYSSQLDRRNNDPVQVSDDTPRVNAAPDTTVTYYVAGVGRIEENGAHWRTDLRFYNSSSVKRTVALEYHYVPAGTTTEQVLFSGGTLGAGQGVSVDDVIAQLFAPGNLDRTELMNGSVIGLLKVTYTAPPDIASAPLIIGGRIYQDLPAGTAGMQLSVYSSDQSVSGASGKLYMAGAQTNLRFRTNVGIFAMGDLPTTVRITAVKQDGSEGGRFEYTLNSPGQSGAFAQIPITQDAFPEVDGLHPMSMKVEALDGSPVGAYIVTLDNISSDTVFVQGTAVH